MKKFFYFAGVVFSATAIAQENAFLTPMGPYEGIAGNTGIARDGSVGSVIYNPAGLATLKTTKISASGSAFSSNRINLEGEGLDEEIEYIQTVPGQITTSFNRDKFTWAFSIIVPKSQEFNYAIETGVESVDRYNLDGYRKLQETLLGPTLAFQASRSFKVGASLFVLKRDEKDSDLEYEDYANSSSQDYTESDISTLSILPVFGLLFTPTEKLAMGLKFSAPSFHLSGDVKSKNRYVEWDDSGNGVCPPGQEPDGTCSLAWFGKDAKGKAKYEKPMELGLGVTLNLTEKLKILADATYQFKKRLTVFESNDAVDSDYEINYKGTTRLNMGFEYMTSQTDALTFGLMYNPDPLEDSDLDFIGGTLGYRSLDDIADSSFGLFYNQASEKSDGVERNQMMVGLFISTSINFIK